MGVFRHLGEGMRSLMNRRARNGEIEAEVDGFVASSVEEKMRRGMSREDAMRAARAEVGSPEMVRNKVWAAGWESAVESVGADVRFGVRQMLRSPGFTVIAILSLALGIGANTAIFTMMNDLLLKQLPVRDPQRLVSFGDGSSSGTVESSSPGPYDIFPYEFYRRVASGGGQFEGVAAFASFQTMVSVRTGAGGGAATQATSHLVSGSFFETLGAEPVLGRALRPEDSRVEGGNPVAVISHRYWQQMLASDPAVVGRPVQINGTAYTVVGVMPAAFYGVELNEQAPDMWLPITMQPAVMQGPSLLKPDGLLWVDMVGRLKTGVSAGQAQAWTTAMFQRFMMDRPGTQITEERRQAVQGMSVPLLPVGSGFSHLRRSYQAPLTVLMVMVGVVLLIACANLANLLLAKAASREREFAARLALGSSRGRVVRQILTEALLLALTGGLVGLGLAYWATGVIIRFMAGGAKNTPLSARPDWHVLLFTFAVCVLTAILFGLAPAWRGARSNAAGALSANARTAGGAAGRLGRLFPRSMIVAQVTLCLVLLTVAGLLLRTLENLRGQDLGFNRSNVLLVRTNPKFAGYKPEQLNALYDRILTRLDALPGVRSAAISGAPPMSGGNWGSPIFIDGRPTGANEDVSAYLNRVSANYFETMGIPLLRGRTIGAQDTASSIQAVVVNQTLAERYFPNGDALGRTFKVADPSVKGTWQIVGIVRDAKYNKPSEKPEPFAYFAVTQLTEDDQYAYWLEVRSVGDPAKVTGEVRAALAEIDANLPILETRTIEEQVESLLQQQRFFSQLAGFFALLALALAAIGLYGVMTYNVVRRTPEFGVRMALGAPRSGVLWLVLREALVLLVAGVAVGVPASLAASRAIRAGLFGVSAFDPVTLAGAVVMIGVVLLAGSYFPARRATRIDPMAALRCE